MRSLPTLLAGRRPRVLALAATALLALGAWASADSAFAADIWRAARSLVLQTTSDTTVVYGPKAFATPTGASQLHVETFTVTLQANTRYLLRMQNGSATGTNKATGGSVRLNGAEIFTTTEIASGVSVQTKVVRLAALDTLQVTVSGAAGSYVTISALAMPDPTFTVYGPRTVVRSGNGGGSVVESFTVPASAGRPGYFHLQNGRNDGSMRATSVTIKLNGTTIVGPSDLNEQIAGIVKEVPLLTGSNSIDIRTSVGSELTLRIAAADSATPKITLTAPPVGMVTGDTIVSVTGSVSDQTPVSITVNGAPATVTQTAAQTTSFSATVKLLAGANPITVTAIDAAGKRSDSLRTVTRDTHAPAITLTSPVDQLVTMADSVTVAGTAADTLATTVTVNGVAVVRDALGAFTTRRPVANGTNFFTVVARNSLGNSSTEVRTVFRDAANPVLTVTEPADNLVTNASTVTVRGSVTDETAVTVTVNGAPATVGVNGAFELPVTLANGANTILVQATDAAGHSVSSSRTVRRDATAPTITIAEPANGTTTTASSVTIAGTVTDESSVELTINDTPVSLGSGGAFSVSRALQEGANSFVLTATDAAGNAISATRTVTREAPSAPDVLGDGQLPIDRTLGATALRTSGITTVQEGTAFLYTGEDPVQIGVSPGTIEQKRAAVVRGRVTTRDGQPLAGVNVVIVGHPEYGYTITRENGLYDMAVNGGAQLRVRFSKAGFLPSQREVATRFNDYSVAEDVALVPLDPAVTVVDFTQPVTVARANVATDERGSRRATLMFEQGTQVQIVSPNGTKTTVPQVSVRATEYTVGPNGPAAMPGALPPTMAYTYAVELSVDEAIAAGSDRVEFSKPVSFYVENFLDVPVGMAVPVGFFDRSKGTWIGQKNGIVMKIVGVTNGLADISVDTSGVPATAARLLELGFTDAERQKLAQTYAVGQELWRMETTHFTPCDMNFLWGLFGDAIGPDVSLRMTVEVPECNQAGSIIGCEKQTLGEVLPVSGTPFALRYSSERQSGYRANNRITARVIGDSVPLTLNRIEMWAIVAGQRFITRVEACSRNTLTGAFEPQPIPKNAELSIDLGQRTDPYGRPLNGAYPVTGEIRYVYATEYKSSMNAAGASWARFDGGAVGISPSFGDPTSLTCGRFTATTGGSTANPEIVMSVPFTDTIGTLEAKPTFGLGGWSLTAHHAYDPIARTLHMGDERTRYVEAQQFAPKTFAGNGAQGFGGDSVPATSVPLFLTYDNTMAFLENGDLVFVEGDRLRRVTPDGKISTFLSSGITSPGFLTRGPDGWIYLTNGPHNIARISPQGTSVNYYPGGFDFYSDAIHISQARWFNISGLAVSPDGEIYTNSQYTNRIRRISADSMAYFHAGSGAGCIAADSGTPALQVGTCDGRLRYGPDGSLYLMQPGGVRKFKADGRMDPIYYPWGSFPGRAMAFDAKGNLFVSSETQVFRYETKTRDWTHIAGLTSNSGAGCWWDGDNQRPQESVFCNIRGIEFGPDGYLYIIDAGLDRIRRIVPPMPGLSTEEMSIVSEDGSAVYVFDRTGRHLRTLDAVSKRALLTFAYDTAGRILSVADADSNVTSIARDAAGKATAIVGPYGERTELVIGNDGYLAQLTNLAGESVRMRYASNALLDTLISPKGFRSVFTYHGDGRLLRDDNSAGGFKTLARADSAGLTRSTVTTAMGRKTSYAIEWLKGDLMKRTVTDPAGLRATSTTLTDGSTEVVGPDGTEVTSKMAADPRFGMQAPYASSVTVRMPSGLTTTMRRSRTATLPTAQDPFSVTQIIDSTIVNNRVFTSTWDRAARTVTSRSAAGRTTTTLLDGRDRVIETRTPGFAPVTYEYDYRGRLWKSTQAGRTVTYTYDDRGRMHTVTDPLNRTTTYAYDSVGRVTRKFLPGGREIAFGYDANGNLTSVTPPGRTAHTFAHGAADRLDSAKVPSVNGQPNTTRYTYNLDGQLDTIVRMDGSRIAFGFDTAGRPIRATTPDGTIRFGYSPLKGTLDTVTNSSGALAFTYDGSLPKSVTWSGAVQGSVSLGYDANARVGSVSVNGQNPISYTYDNDGLLTGAGALTLGRDATSALLRTATIGSTTSRWSYDSLGQLDTLVAQYNGADLFRSSYSLDSLGRIRTLAEVIKGVTRTFEYAYDSAGRLHQVRLDGVVQSTYQYDANANRLSLTTPNGVLSGTYDAQDRMLSYGNATYAYAPTGELREKVVGADTSRYVYDALGNLRSVRLPDGTLVEYVVDPLNRRTGRKVNGALTQRWIYQGRLAPAAELDAAGNVVSRFVYGTRINVPDYIIKGGATYRVITDHVGSVRLVVNVSTGAVIQRLDYDEFGQVTQDTNAGFQPFGYAGGLVEQLTGLTRFGARDYDARTGRWTAVDPAGISRVSNLYTYADNEPISLVDPDGRLPIPLIAAGAVLGGALGGAFYAATADEFTIDGFAGAVLSGAVTGGIGTIATPLAAAMGLGTGVLGTAAVNASLGVVGALLSAGTDPCVNLSAGYVVYSAVGGAVGGYLAGYWFPVQGMSVFKQFVGFPRSWAGVVPRILGGKMRVNARNGIWLGGFTSFGIGSATTALPQLVPSLEF